MAASHLVEVLEPEITVQELEMSHVSLKLIAGLQYWLGRTLQLQLQVTNHGLAMLQHSRQTTGPDFATRKTWLVLGNVYEPVPWHCMWLGCASKCNKD